MPRFGVPVQYKRVDTLRELDLIFLPDGNQDLEPALFLTSKTGNDWSSYALDLTQSLVDEFVAEIRNEDFVTTVGQDYAVQIDDYRTGRDNWDGFRMRFPPLALGEAFQGILFEDPFGQTHFGRRVIVDLKNGSYLNPDHIENVIYFTDWSISVGTQKVFEATGARTDDP